MAGEFYVDTKRAAQDTPNVFSAFVESYMGYRMPAQMTILRARINALAQTQAGLQAIDLELANDAKTRADLYKSAADLAGKQLAGGAERDKTLGTVIVSEGGITQAEVSGAATTGAANAAASAAVAKANIERDAKRMEMESEERRLAVTGLQALDLEQTKGGKVNTAASQEVEAAFQAAITDTGRLATEQGFSEEAGAMWNARLDEVVRDLYTKVQNPAERGAIAERLRASIAADGRLPPQVRARLVADTNLAFKDLPTQAPDYSVDPPQAGVDPKVFLAGAPKAGTVSTRLGGLAKGYVDSGVRDLASGGGELGAGGEPSLLSTFQATREAAPDVQPVLKGIMDEIAREDDRKQALLDARDRIAEDPFGGLGSWREPLGGLKERAAKPAPKAPRPMLSYGGGRATDETGREVKPPKMPKPEPVEANRDTKPAKSTARNAFLDDLEGMSTGGKLFMQANQRAGTDIAPASEMTDKRKRGKKPKKRDATMYELEAS